MIPSCKGGGAPPIEKPGTDVPLILFTSVQEFPEEKGERGFYSVKCIHGGPQVQYGFDWRGLWKWDIRELRQGRSANLKPE